MLGDLDLVLGEECRAIGVEEVGIGEVDVPLDAGARIEDRAVVVEAIANDGQSASAERPDLARKRKRDLRPPAVLEPTGVDCAGRTRDREDHLLVLVAEHRRVLSHQLGRLVGAPLERLGDRRISRLGHLPSIVGPCVRVSQWSRTRDSRTGAARVRRSLVKTSWARPTTSEPGIQPQNGP